MQVVRPSNDLDVTATPAMRRAVRLASLKALSWLVARVDSYVMRVYCQHDESVRRARPSWKYRQSSTRRYTVVSPSGAREAMGKARASRANLRQTLSLRDHAAELGCHGRQADRWIAASNMLYVERVSAVFAQLDHWNVVADPGTNSDREVMPAALYGWDLDMVGFVPFQRLAPARAGVAPGYTELDPTIVPYVKTMSLTRVATFRQLQ